MAYTFYVYIMTNKRNNVLYTGRTSGLEGRVYQHKNKIYKGFTYKYNLNRLIYFEEFESEYESMLREKQIKGWTRTKKETLIKTINPTWNDLAENWF